MSNHYDPTKAISPSAAYPEVTFEHHTDNTAFKKKVWRTTWLLSIITIMELAIGFSIYVLHKGNPSYFFVLSLKGIVCILTLAKAYYIVSVFMHLGDEIRNFIMTIVVPLLLFVWIIIAFLGDGESYKNLRNTYDKHFEQTTMPKQHTTAPDAAPAKGEGH